MGKTNFSDDFKRDAVAQIYTLSTGDAPEQDIENGVVTIRVIEGFFGRIDFVGDETDRPAGSTIRERAVGMTSDFLRSRPLIKTDLERYLLLMSDLPGPVVSGAWILHSAIPWLRHARPIGRPFRIS